jgi:hypothetical protein
MGYFVHEENNPGEGQERFAAVSVTEMNELLANRHSKATKNVTNWSVSTFKGGLFTKILFNICF